MRMPPYSRQNQNYPRTAEVSSGDDEVHAQIHRELAELVPMAPVTVPVSGPLATPHPTTAAVRHLYQRISGMSIDDPCSPIVPNRTRLLALDQNGEPIANVDQRLFMRLANQSAPNAVTPHRAPQANGNDILEDSTDPDAVSGLSDSDWLSLALVDTDGGEIAPEFGAENALRNDRSVYSTARRRNINMLLENTTPLTPLHGVPCTLHEVCIRVPQSGFTAPLHNGFIFVCSEPVPLEAFNTYNSVDTTLLLHPRTQEVSQMLPQVPPSVRTVLYFQLDPNASVFRYKFQTSISDARYLFVKMLNPVGHGCNIDVEFLGFKGKLCKLAFPFGNLA